MRTPARDPCFSSDPKKTLASSPSWCSPPPKATVDDVVLQRFALAPADPASNSTISFNVTAKHLPARVRDTPAANPAETSAKTRPPRTSRRCNSPARHESAPATRNARHLLCLSFCLSRMHSLPTPRLAL
uniref:Uncharacterized protein n=1 Tax=Zea mays TaxID=4577 RepID=A0A804QWV1_MAIZE